jgi:hypothetical protein
MTCTTVHCYQQTQLSEENLKYEQQRWGKKERERERERERKKEERKKKEKPAITQPQG